MRAVMCPYSKDAGTDPEWQKTSQKTRSFLLANNLTSEREFNILQFNILVSVVVNFSYSSIIERIVRVGGLLL